MQSKRKSLVESTANTAIAVVITMTVLPLVNWVCGVSMNFGQMGSHVALMTVISIARNYFIRRIFNRLK